MPPNMPSTIPQNRDGVSAEGVVQTDHEVGEGAGLNIDEFYARLFILYNIQINQNGDLDLPKNDSPQREHADSTTRNFLDLPKNDSPQREHADLTTRNFLDHFAAVFAGTKGVNSPNHVTATALCREGLLPGKVKLVIYIAKNGPWGRYDEKLAGNLCEWLNSLDITPCDSWLQRLPRLEVNTWENMLRHSRKRISEYIRKINTKSDIFINQLLETVKDLPDDEMKVANAFRELDAILSLCERHKLRMQTIAPEERDNCQKDDHHSLTTEAAKFERGKDDAFYRRMVAVLASDESMGKRLPFILEQVDYLGKLPRAWLAFWNFRREHPNCVFECKAVEMSEVQTFPTNALQEIETLWTLFKGSNELDTKTVTNFETKFKELKMKPVELFFHCELQLLQYFLSHPKLEVVYDYFGCSKNSCWLCWNILQAESQFTTGEPHHKIYYKCSIPRAWMEIPEIVMGLKRCHTYMEEKLLCKMQDWEEFSEHPETNPGKWHSTEGDSKECMDIGSERLAEVDRNASMPGIDWEKWFPSTGKPFHELRQYIRMKLSKLSRISDLSYKPDLPLPRTYVPLHISSSGMSNNLNHSSKNRLEESNFNKGLEELTGLLVELDYKVATESDMTENDITAAAEYRINFTCEFARILQRAGKSIEALRMLKESLDQLQHTYMACIVDATMIIKELAKFIKVPKQGVDDKMHVNGQRCQRRQEDIQEDKPCSGFEPFRATNIGFRTHLCWAVATGNIDSVELLLKAHVDVNAKDNSGITALSLATSRGRVDIVELLLRNDADANMKCKADLSPLSSAANDGLVEIAELLLKYGANVEGPEDAMAPLNWAARGGHVTTVELLLREEANIEGRDDVCNFTPLTLAAGSGHVDTVQLLFEKKANIVVEDRFWDDTPFGWAVGYKNIVEKLESDGYHVPLHHILYQD